MNFSKPILSQDIWAPSRDQCDPVSPETFRLHYERARSMCREIGLTIEDIRDLTPKFWSFHFDLIAVRDMTAFIIATIHLNLCIGTLCSFLPTHPDLSPLLDDLLHFEKCGEFMLTEVGHGLDSRNLETTATLLPNGCFDLHSPNEAAWKAMPPSTPLCGMPRVAVVFARLIVGADDRGVKPFVVKLSDKQRMCPGITSRVLPIRRGTKPLDHAITSFEHVLLPPSALLGSKAKPKDIRRDFLRQIWRVSIGTLSLSIMGVSSIRVGSRIALQYSQRRHVAAGHGASRVPILYFSTQKRSIMKGFAISAVLKLFAEWTIDQFVRRSLNDSVRQALATVFKAVVIRGAGVLEELSERCGWQGLFAYNQIKELSLTFQGNSVAEGDTLVLCIRLGSELLGDKYSLPEPVDGSHLLAKHEAGLFKEARAAVGDLGGYGQHRNAAFNDKILPRCRKLVEAIGDRMAYEAASKSGVPSAYLRLYQYECMANDLSWYVENGLVTRKEFAQSRIDAHNAAHDFVLRFDSDIGQESDYITAPIFSDNLWSKHLHGLQTFHEGCLPTHDKTVSKL